MSVKINKKRLRKFLEAMRRTKEITYGTAPQYHAKTRAYIRCRVMIAIDAGQMILISPAEAREWAKGWRAHLSDHPGDANFMFCADHARDLDEMAAIAEDHDRRRPSFEEAAEQTARLQAAHALRSSGGGTVH